MDAVLPTLLQSSESEKSDCCLLPVTPCTRMIGAVQRPLGLREASAVCWAGLYKHVYDRWLD